MGSEDKFEFIEAVIYTYSFRATHEHTHIGTFAHMLEPADAYVPPFATLTHILT